MLSLKRHTHALPHVAALLTSTVALLPAPAPAEVGQWSRRWTLELPTVADAESEFQAGCAPTGGEHLRLVVATKSGEQGAVRELSLATLSRSGNLESMTAIAHPNDPLSEVHRCLVLENGELMIFAAARSGAILALESAGAQWKPDLRLGDGGYDVRIHDAAWLGDRRFVAVGAKKRKGFVVVLDTADRTVEWRDWESRDPSLVADVESGAGASTICGLEADLSGELFSKTSGLFLASLTESGSFETVVRMPGRACRLLTRAARETSVGLLLEGGESIPGPLRLLDVGASLEPIGEQQLLGSVFFLYSLKLAQAGSSFAVLNELPARESIEVFSSANDARIGSARLDVFPGGPMDVLAFGEEYLVVSHRPAVESNHRRVRIDLFHSP